MPQSLGRYILERSIAHGGMGEVFHARQTGPDGFDRTCVVKTMHPNLASDPELVEMFLEEARLTARLTHPHVAQVYDFGKIDTAYYIAMELVDGPSLHNVVKAFALRAAKLPVGSVLRIVSQAAQALDYVHRLKAPDGTPLNLVHRDISPGNLLLSKDGLVKLIDFGIAKAATTARQTRMGQIRGKLAYMSPEQMLGMPLDGRTDIYSMGLVLFELLSGRRANPGRNEVEILSAVKTATLAPIRSLRDDCPDSLSEVLERATARDREQRYQRAAELSEALEQCIVETGHAVTVGDLCDIAEEVALSPPKPSPAMLPRPSPRENAPTRAGVHAAADDRTGVVPPPSESPMPRSRRAGAVTTMVPLGVAGQPAPKPQGSKVGLIALGALLFVALGAGAGVLIASSTRGDDPKPKGPPTVVALPPAQPVRAEPQAAAADPAPAALVQPAPVPAPMQPEKAPPAAPHKNKSRWAKAEKFERAPDKEPAPAAAAAPEPEPAPAPARPASSTGAVQVQSDPPTEIWVDGKQVGVTPTTLQLDPGAHRVELREPRLRLSFMKSVDADPANPQKINWKPARGFIDVRPIPPQVELQIAVDGVTIGPTPISEFSVWEGSRRISARNTATGWQTEKSVEVPPGARVKIKVNDGAGMEVSSR